MSKRCKNGKYCDTPKEDLVLEASGYCFTCAEELACLLADEGFDPSSAWNAPKKKSQAAAPATREQS